MKKGVISSSNNESQGVRDATITEAVYQGYESRHQPLVLRTW